MDSLSSDSNFEISEIILLDESCPSNSIDTKNKTNQYQKYHKANFHIKNSEQSIQQKSFSANSLTNSEDEEDLKKDFAHYNQKMIMNIDLNIYSSDNQLKQEEESRKPKNSKEQTENSQNEISQCQEISLKSEGIQNQKNEEKSKKIKFSTYLINKYLNGQKLFSDKRKYYLFSDQAIDLDFFINFDQKDQYIKDMSKQQLHKGLRFINQIVHRMDNKFIEVDLEYYPTDMTNFDYIVSFFLSLGNKDLIIFTEMLKEFWLNIQSYKLTLQEERNDPVFKKHLKAREAFCKQKYEDIISKLDPNEMIYFVNHVPNNEKCLYESKSAGYSPEMYEILAQNSYKFKDVLQKNGCYDPRSYTNQLDRALTEASCCIYAISQGLIPPRVTTYTNTDLITCDNFVFPTQMITDIYILNHEYDQEHGLNFRSQQILAVNTFKFLDENLKENFKKFRFQQEEDFQYHSIEQPFESLQDNTFYGEQLHFFEKYYADSISDLYRFGNKWLKRCGFVDIPKKKKKLLHN